MRNISPSLLALSFFFSSLALGLEGQAETQEGAPLKKNREAVAQANP